MHSQVATTTTHAMQVPACKEDARVVIMHGEHDTLASIPVELAITEVQRNLGLMYRDVMADSCGMLFIFEHDQPLSFWMKNTVLSLDMFFVRADGRIATVHEFTTPFSEGAYPASEPCTYVLETTAGFRARHKIALGDKLTFTRK